jgi:hypothetical protein
MNLKMKRVRVSPAKGREPFNIPGSIYRPSSPATDLSHTESILSAFWNKPDGLLVDF